MSGDPFELCRRFGIQVVEVEHLSKPLVYVIEEEVALIRRGLDDERRQRLADWLLTEALTEATA